MHIYVGFFLNWRMLWFLLQWPHSGKSIFKLFLQWNGEHRVFWSAINIGAFMFAALIMNLLWKWLFIMKMTICYLFVFLFFNCRNECIAEIPLQENFLGGEQTKIEHIFNANIRNKKTVKFIDWEWYSSPTVTSFWMYWTT